jgi:biopolymer transport protein ExbD
MAALNQNDDMIAGINVTPLVDIVLVLLIVFMVTAKVLVSPALAMNVPPSAHSTEVQSPLSIEIAADGRVLVSGARVENDAAVVALARAAQSLAGIRRPASSLVSGGSAPSRCRK